MFNITRTFNKIGFWGKKHSPELLIATGIVSAAASIGLAIYSTTKLEKNLKPYKEQIARIKVDLKDDNKIANKIVDPKYSKKELTKTYLKVTGKVAALYAPSAILFTTSIGCILGSHNIMRNRNLALAAVCTTLERSYKLYRDRVKEALGEKEEEDIYKDIRKEKVEYVDPKTGKPKTKTVSVPHTSLDGSEWNALYDCGNAGWDRDARICWDFLMTAQTFLTDKLKRQGYLFLSDVWDYLGFTTAMIGPAKMRASHILGWIYDPTNPERDNEIRFGLTQKNSLIPLPEIAAQISRNESAFWLSMNVDGDILSGEYGKETFAKYAKEGH